MAPRLAPILSFATGAALAALFAVGYGDTSTGAPPNEPDDVAALARAVDPGVGRECIPSEQHHADADPEHLAFDRTARGLALVVCRPLGRGIVSLYAWRFRTLEELEFRASQWHRYVAPVKDGVCDESLAGHTTWADAAGRSRGDLLCVRRPDNGGFVIWSEPQRLLLFEAGGDDARDLNTWWRAHVRDLAAFPTAEEKKLLALAGKVIDTDSCRREDVYSSPLAVASLRCQAPSTRSGRPVGADMLRLERFAQGRQLDAHYANYVAGWARQASEHVPDSTCLDGSPLEIENWYRLDKLAGALVCFPALGSQYIAWTHDDARLFAVLTRGDQATRRAAAAWATLSEIGQ